MVLGDVPGTPTAAPTKTQSASSSTALMVEYLAVADSQGQTIISYSLEIDLLLTGSFTALTGNPVDSMALSHIATGLERGKTYGFRYRCKNAYGWSSYSPVSHLLVAVAPDKP